MDEFSTEAPPEGWSWFDEGTPPHRPDLGVMSAFARCFGSEDGAVVMAHLRLVTVERALGADTPVAVLRHLEGQRQLVGYMAGMAKRGRGDGSR